MEKQNLLKDKKAIGVIVCRMQVPYLTDSHFSLLKTVFERHNRVIIFLGCTNKPIDETDPYPFEFRKQMIEQAIQSDLNTCSPDSIFSWKAFTIVPLPDSQDNVSWVTSLDNMINAFTAFDEEAHLYGGRDSFLPYYKKDNGKFDCTELAAKDYDSGTELRMINAIEMPKYSADAARAILWALRQK